MNEELYFKDAFTEVDGNINLDVNNLNANCITSKNNKFSLDSEGNLVVNSITTAVSNDSNIDFDSIYPVGSIYFSVNNINPSTLFGGTWEQIKDRFLLACGDVYNNNTIGGAVNHNHTLNNGYARIGCHGGQMFYNRVYGTLINYNQSITRSSFNPDHIDENKLMGVGTTLAGTTDNSDNMPPYLTVFVWKRIS